MTSPAPNPPACILLVDDEPNVLATLMPVLERMGYLVLTERNPRAVIDRMIARRGPEVEAMLIDLRMPQMDGTELLARLQAIDPALPVLILTGYGSVQTIKEATERGAFDFLTKPSTPMEIATALARAVAWRRAQRSNSGGTSTASGREPARPATGESAPSRLPPAGSGSSLQAVLLRLCSSSPVRIVPA